MSSCTFERFTKDVEQHQLNVLKDDGLYRHLKVAKPNTNSMHYNITTWPGYLCISGDMGCFTFYRLTDMFEFFRGTPGSINPTYWQEKVQAGAGHSGANAITSEPDFDAYETRLKEYLAEFVESLDPQDESEAQRIEEATDAVNDFINSYERSEYDVVSRINEWDTSDAGGMELVDFWDGGLDKFRFHYIWCCYAIVHAIHMYDTLKTGEVSA